VEAVVALPFLLLVLVCVSYVRTAALEERRAAAHARSCAWKYSESNCDVVPPGCSDVVEVLDGGDAADASLRALEEGTAVATGGSPEIAGVVGQLLAPVLSAAFGRSTRAEVARDVARPGLLGGGTSSVRGDFVLACNLRPMHPVDVALEAWKVVVP
jgi:hypothetical protein